MHRTLIINIYYAKTSLLLPREGTRAEWRTADSDVTAPEGDFA
jgi:hypothetical protein